MLVGAQDVPPSLHYFTDTAVLRLLRTVKLNVEERLSTAERFDKLVMQVH